MNKLLNLALGLLAEGFSIFPVISKTKTPIVKWKEFQTRLAKEDELKKFFNHDNLNIGLATGALSGVVVVEGDSAEEVNWIKENLPQTPLKAYTRKGVHFYYRHPGNGIRVKNAQKLVFTNRTTAIDVRGDGGYVVLPPSLHHSGFQYTWDGDWRGSRDRLPTFSWDWFPLENPKITKARRYLEKIPGAIEGNAGDIHTYTTACRLVKKFGLTVDEAFPLMKDWNSKCEPPWPEDDLLRKVQNAEIYGESDRDNSSNHEISGDYLLPYQEFTNFFREVLPGAKRNILTGTLMLLQKEIWESVQSRYEILESLAIDRGLKHSQIKSHLARFTEEFPLELLIDIPAWDGVDRISKFASALDCKNFTPDQVYELLCDWGSKMFQRLENPMIQNRVLVLKGLQGLGKDFYLYCMLGAFRQFKADLQISADSKDTYISLSEHLLITISEFDRTNRVESSFIKDLITRDHVVVRRPYERSSQRLAIRCSFAATVNVDEILRDPTGARRFIILDLKKIDWSYPQDQSPQLLAQFKKLALEEYKASEETEAILRNFLELHTPEDPKELVLELFDQGGGLPLSDGPLTLKDIDPQISEISRSFKIPYNRVLSILKANGRSKREKFGMVYYRFPRVDKTIFLENDPYDI